MSHLIFFRTIIFLNISLITNCFQEVLYETPNIKTVLFNEIDVRRSCWNHDEINLLKARMIMQDLIPKKIPRDIQYLIEYIRSTEEATIIHSPEGKVRRIMMLALADVLGGYLQAVAIPMAKEAYYAGNIDYSTMARLYELLNEMKTRLRTDGGLWSRPIDMSKFSVKVTALHLPMENSELACKAMFVTPVESCAPGTSRIAIPYLDFDHKPGAVALPLKSRNLYSLKTAASSHIIVRFYILARQCLAGMPTKDSEMFNFLFIKWLVQKVVPHLYEDTWYSGFGSVMRIVETVNETEIFEQVRPYYVGNDNRLENVLIHNKACGIVGSVRSMAKYKLWWLLFFIFIFLLLLLICCGCCCWLYKMGYNVFGKRKSSTGILNAVLSVYCGLKDKNSQPTTPSNVKQAFPSAGTYNRSYSKWPYQTIHESSSNDDESMSSEDEETKTATSQSKT